MSAVFRLQSALLRNRGQLLAARTIATSKKNADSATATTAPRSEACAQPVHTTKRRNWQSYGFDVFEKEEDRNAMHSIMFVSVTLCIVVSGFNMLYAPDYGLHDWSQREAFIELRRREDAGLPAIDKNIVEASRVKLPSDEELGDQEIII